MWWKSLKNIVINLANCGNMETNGNLVLSSSSSGLLTTVRFLIFLQVSASIVLPTATEYSTAHFQPYFDFDVQRNVTFTFGQTGFLHCKVERIGDKDVSWIRKRDLHILTAGILTYTSDQRFQVIKSENSHIWTLQIKYLQFRDSGIYECQINTEPKISLSFNLHVIETKANISGPTDLYVKSGSDINLVCIISKGPHEMGNIFWFKETDLLDGTSYYDTDVLSNELSNRISIETDWSDGLHSRLNIQKAVQNDTGNYTCVPSVAQPASVYVHIINGERHPAAMQRNTATTKSHHHSLLSIILLIIQSHSICQIDIKISSLRIHKTDLLEVTQ